MPSGFVSIIIPAFNRAHLIGETLDSIIAQSYKNWECLVVDDGSTDTTINIIEEYVENDNRIKLFERPDIKPKGANACRNIGLNKAQGNYVIFFDSDDLMTDNHLEVKLSAIQKFDCDYVITKTQFFNYSNEGMNRNYAFDKFLITPYNYVTQKINWLTYDILLKISLAKSIGFNENLQSGQEYNYFSKLVHITTKGKFIDKVVTLRRYHENSIRGQINKNDALKESSFKVSWYTYLDLKTISDREVLEVFMHKCMRICYEMKSIPIICKFKFTKEVYGFYGFKSVYFVLMLFNRRFFNAGYVFLQKLLEK